MSAKLRAWRARSSDTRGVGADPYTEPCRDSRQQIAGIQPPIESVDILADVETDVRARFERIEAILESVAKRQERFDKQLQAAAARQDRFDKQLQAAAARQDRFDRQLQATAKLVAEGVKIVRTLARDTRELKRSQKAFLESLRHGGNGRGPGRN